MTVSQLSIFAESKPGHLARVLGVFEGAGVSVRGFSVADTGEYGITRFIVDKPQAAAEALEAGGFAYIVSQVLCLRLKDEPGELGRIMALLASASENVSYAYSMISTYIIIGTEDLARTRRLLTDAGYEMVTQDDVTRANAGRMGEES